MRFVIYSLAILWLSTLMTALGVQVRSETEFCWWLAISTSTLAVASRFLVVGKDRGGRTFQGHPLLDSDHAALAESAKPGVSCRET
jgi:hypothetical protein